MKWYNKKDFVYSSKYKNTHFRTRKVKVFNNDIQENAQKS